MHDEAWERLAGAVRVRRRSLGLTQAELAAAVGVSEPTIRVIETARRDSYKPATLRDLARALGWTSKSIELVFDGKDPVELPDEEDDLRAVVADLRERLARVEAQLATEPPEGGRNRTDRPA